MTGVEHRDLWSLFAARTGEHPERVVLDFDGNLWTWAELIDAAEALAGGLAGAGVARGDVVCHMSPNHPEAVVTMLGLLRLGAVECPVNAGLRGQQLAHVLNHSGARMLILDGSLADRVAEQLPAAPDITTVVQRGPGLAPAPAAAAQTVPSGSGSGPQDSVGVGGPGLRVPPVWLVPTRGFLSVELVRPAGSRRWSWSRPAGSRRCGWSRPAGSCRCRCDRLRRLARLRHAAAAVQAAAVR